MINRDAALKWGGIFFVCGMKQKKEAFLKTSFSSERGDSNARPLRPERSALPTALLSDCFRKWCHQGLMYPCKDLYLNALPLAYIKKPRDWHV